MNAHLVAGLICGTYGPGLDLDWFANGYKDINCRDVDWLRTLTGLQKGYRLNSILLVRSFFYVYTWSSVEAQAA